jgi:hypothetical protein
MATVALGLVSAGLLVVVVTWGAYLASIPKGNVAARPVGSIILQLLGVGLAIVGVTWPLCEGGAPGVGLIIPASLATMMGGLFLFLLTQRKTPIGNIKVSVGDKLLAFASQDSDGNSFHSDSLAGKRVFLKFFRGGW